MRDRDVLDYDHKEGGQDLGEAKDDVCEDRLEFREGTSGEEIGNCLF